MVLGRAAFFFEMKQALTKAAKEGIKLDSIASTPGLDFGLVRGRRAGGVPVHYRDTRTDGIMDEAFKVMPKAKIFERTAWPSFSSTPSSNSTR
jgi:hypothetical protein